MNWSCAHVRRAAARIVSGIRESQEDRSAKLREIYLSDKICYVNFIYGVIPSLVLVSILCR